MKIEFLRKTSNMLRVSEACARLCYHSFKNVNDNSQDLLTKIIIPNKHEQVIESNSVIFRIEYYDNEYKLLFKLATHSMISFVNDTEKRCMYMVGNVRMYKDLFRNLWGTDVIMIPTLKLLRDEIYKNVPYQFFVDMSDIFIPSDFSQNTDIDEIIELDFNSPYQIISKMFDDEIDIISFLQENHIVVMPDDICKFNFATVLINSFNRTDANQLVRHRAMSFAQRSQRYVKEQKLDFVLSDDVNTDEAKAHLTTTLDLYNTLLENGSKAENARAILPNCASTKIMVSGTGDRWYDLYCKRGKNKAAQQNIRITIRDIYEDLYM